MKYSFFAALCAVALGFGVLGSLSGCSPDSSNGVTDVPERTPEAPAPTDRTFDDMMADVARQVPGFGGAYIAEDGTMEIVMVAGASAGAAESALRSVFPMENVEYAGIRVREGKYAFDQLKAWHDAGSRTALAAEGVVFTDIDERSNVLRVGISNPAARAAVEAAFAAVPAGALIIEETSPVVFELRNRRRPLVGGLQNSWQNSSGTFFCTIGFVARRAGVTGFVTNSHCSGIQGGVQNTVFHQPTVSGTTNRVGLETADPTYFTGGACPAGRRCRYSDAAFVRVPHPSGPATTTSLGRIARTSIGSFAWNGTSLYTILGKQIPTFMGEAVQKTGRTTGTTTGRVNNTCINVSVSGTTITMLCQGRANYVSGPGDSGSPVYRVINPTAFSVALMGIHWGSSVAGGAAGDRFFSKMDRVDAELTTLTVN